MARARHGSGTAGYEEDIIQGILGCRKIEGSALKAAEMLNQKVQQLREWTPAKVNLQHSDNNIMLAVNFRIGGLR